MKTNAIQPVLLTILMGLGCFMIFSCDGMTNKERFDKMVYDAYHRKYDGVVIDKYVAENEHNRYIVELKHELFGIDKIDFTFQSHALFDLIKVGDTVLKKRESLAIKIKRNDLDTIVRFDYWSFEGKNFYYENPYLFEEIEKK